MGRDLYDGSAAARSVFEQADDALGFALSKLCFEGPAGELTRTINAQPAIMTVSLACLAAAIESGALAERPASMAGHSLGEYTALVAAGALSLPEGVRLVRERGRLMQEAGERNPGTLAAIVGLDEGAVEELCQATGAEICNRNSAEQTVIGGPPGIMERAMAEATARGAKRVAPLVVSGAFHSSLMTPAAEGLAAAVAAAQIAEPQIPVMANGTGAPLLSVPAIRTELVYQVNHRVLWQRSIERMAANGVTLFYEIGPGRVLTGLIRRIAPDATTQNFSDLAASAGSAS